MSKQTNVTTTAETLAKIPQIEKSLHFSKLGKGTLLTMDVVDKAGIKNTLQYSFDFPLDCRTVMTVLRESSAHSIEGLSVGHKPAFGTFVTRIRHAHGETNTNAKSKSNGLSATLQYAVKQCFANRPIAGQITSLTNKDKIKATLGDNVLEYAEKGAFKLLVYKVHADFYIVTHADYEVWKGRCPISFVTFK